MPWPTAWRAIASTYQAGAYLASAVIKLRDSYLQTEAWERLGVPKRDVALFVGHSPARQLFQQLLMSKIVPQCKRIGLLDAGKGGFGGDLMNSESLIWRILTTARRA